MLILKRNLLVWSLLALLLAVYTNAVKWNKYYADVVIYGATPAGIAAALGAADAGVKNVVLLCEEYDIGGMMTLGGIGLRDHNANEMCLNGTMLEWIELNNQYYKEQGYDYKDPVFQPDHYVGIANLWKIIDRRPAISVYLNQWLVEANNSVVKSGTQIVSIRTETARVVKPITVWHAGVFIDATYAGDLMIAAGATWTYGRESRDQYNETLAGVTNHSTGNFEVNISAVWHNHPVYPDGTLLKWVDPPSELKPVGKGDDRLMGYSYRLCVTSNSENKVDFNITHPMPEKYDPDDWEVLRRYYKGFYSRDDTSREVYNPFSYLNYYGYPPGNKYDVCDDGTITPITSDAANLAQGYPNATRARRMSIAKDHKEYLKGLIHFLITDPSVPEAVNETITSHGLCKDEWPENDHWPPVLYVREAGRLVGDYVYIQIDRRPSYMVRRVDSVAVADWSIDIHIMARTYVNSSEGGDPVVRDEGQTPFGGVYAAFEFELPYSILVPRKKELTNLLVPNCPSVSHVVFGAIREEPTLWQLGRASGVAAALYLQQDGEVPLQDLDVKKMQNVLLGQGAVMHYDKEPLMEPFYGIYPPRWGGNNQTLVWQARVNMTDISDSPLHPRWTFDYYYDWTRKASRYDHHQGQYDEVCKGVKSQPQDGRPCTVLNAVDGRLYILFPLQKYCCSCGPVFTIRSDWLQNGGTTYKGQETIGGERTYKWLKYGASDNYYYTTTDSERKPVRYMEHKNGKLKQWDFYSWKPMQSEDLSALLAPPKNCTETCDFSFCSRKESFKFL